MSYPTIEQLRAFEQHARSMSDAYLAEGNEAKANQRDEDADWYDLLARREEWRLERINLKKEAA